MLQFTEMDPSILIRKKEELFKEPIVAYVLDFEDQNVAVFKAQVEMAHETGQKILPIVISTFGGDAHGLLEMLDVLTQCELPIATIAEGKCMSAGSVLLSCGKEGYRFCGPHTTIMIHDVSSGVTGKSEEMAANAKEADRLNQKILKLMAKNVGKGEGYFLDLIHQKGHADWYLTPEQAKKHNLVNHIRLPTLKTKISVETVLE